MAYQSTHFWRKFVCTPNKNQPVSQCFTLFVVILRNITIPVYAQYFRIETHLFNLLWTGEKSRACDGKYDKKMTLQTVLGVISNS